MTNKNKKKNTFLVKFILKVFFLIVFIFYIFIENHKNNILSKVSSLGFSLFSKIGNTISAPIKYINKKIIFFKNIEQIQQENIYLKQKINEFKSYNTNCDITLLENINLNKQLNIIKNIPQKSLIAEIISGNNFLNHTFIINKGANDKLEEGMIVLSQNKQLIGIISQVFSNYSKVQTLTNKNIKVSFRIVGTNIYGFLEGNNTNVVKIGFFSDSNYTPINGSYLVTSNINGSLPKDIYIGSIINYNEVKVLTNFDTNTVIILKYDINNKYIK